MKHRWILYILAVYILQTFATGAPASAETFRHDANREQSEYGTAPQTYLLMILFAHVNEIQTHRSTTACLVY